MPSPLTASRAVKGLLILLLIISSSLVSIAMYNAYSDPLGEVVVSPGKYDMYLGNSTSLVKLSYPNSSILTNSTGDLLFTVTLQPNTQPWCDIANLTSNSNCRLTVDVYIPPDFSGLAISSLWTSFTNNYDSHIISLSRQSSSDQIAPNWWKVTISDLHFTSNSSLTNPTNRVFLIGKSQYIRLFQVTSPTTAGRYFFKAFINGKSIDASNFPTLIVKASRDPAYVSGTLRYLRNVTKAGQPIDLPNGTGARIVATGTDYLGRSVSAQAFINYTANGNYTLFGVAPGTYDITAYAAGYIPTTRQNAFSVAAAQSLEGVDIYMSESVSIEGTVLSTTANGGNITWGYVWQVNGAGFISPANRSISISLLTLDGSTVASFPAPASFAETTDSRKTSFPFAIGSQVALDGRIPQDYASYTSGISSGDYLLRAYVTSYVQLDEVRVHVQNQTTKTVSEIRLVRTGTFTVTVHFKNSSSTIMESPPRVDGTLTVSAYDQQGILRAQNTTFVRTTDFKSGSSNITSIELQGFSNARSFGIASQFSQNGGIRPGTYYFRARFTSSPSYAGYANIGIRDLYYQTEDIQATIGLGEANVSLSLSMYRAGGILLTLQPIDDQTPPVGKPWGFPNSTIKVEIVDSQRNVYQGNATQLQVDALHPNWYNVSFAYIGLLTDNYDVIIHTVGYTQREIPHLNVVLGMNTDAAVWMIKDPVINATIVFRNEGLLSIIDSTQPYAQPINNLGWTPARVEVFDGLGRFVAASVSYIPNVSNSSSPIRYANFTLAGFDRYYGNPRLVWSGFYDTTDAASQDPGGLFLYPWNDAPRDFIIRVWVEGYYQFNPIRVTIPASGNVSVVGAVDRASSISGTVVGPDLYDVARPLSWATINLEPNNNTLTGIMDVSPGYYSTSSLDGSYQVWVPPGRYGMGVSLDGYSSYSAQVEIPSGSDLTMQIWLENYHSSSQAMISKSFMTLALVIITTFGAVAGSDRWLLRKM